MSQPILIIFVIYLNWSTDVVKQKNNQTLNNFGDCVLESSLVSLQETTKRKRAVPCKSSREVNSSTRYPFTHSGPDSGIHQQESNRRSFDCLEVVLLLCRSDHRSQR